jgi:hypothetical protein
VEVKKFGGLPKLQAVLFHSDVQEYIGQEEDGSVSAFTSFASLNSLLELPVLLERTL